MKRTKTKRTRKAKPKRTRTTGPKAPTGITPLVVDRNEAARMLGVSRLTLFNWEKQGAIRQVQLPTSARRRERGKTLRRALFAVADLEKFINEARERG